MRTTIISVLIVILFLLFGCTQQNSDKSEIKELTIYTYDSFVSEYGLGPLVVPKFEEKCNCKVKLVSKGDAGQVVTTLALEKENPKADLAIGIDNTLFSKTVKEGLLEKFVPKNIETVPEQFRNEFEEYLTPYDFGFMAFVFDKDKVGVELNGFEKLLDSSLEKKIVVQDPRTSSPGLALLLWTVAVFGDPDYKEYWKKLKPNILTVTSGWDESAGLFSAGEAPIYLSYATSPPYYVEFEDTNHFLAAEFVEGHFLQVEGMGIVKDAKNRELAQEFIEFSLTQDFQKEIPFTQFMFPVNQSIELPKAFDFALHPKKTVELAPALVEEKEEEWISEWEKIMQSG